MDDFSSENESMFLCFFLKKDCYAIVSCPRLKSAGVTPDDKSLFLTYGILG
ncbi:hypothetical protein [Nitrososphaera viennensis]|nr:hypothetical protein [Nitrososphaera viennensis]